MGGCGVWMSGGGVKWGKVFLRIQDPGGVRNVGGSLLLFLLLPPLWSLPMDEVVQPAHSTS